MIPRGRIDASPWDLLRAWGRARDGRTSGDGPTLRGHALPLLCARAGWSALLAHRRIGDGDAVLMSALTIPDMAELVRARGATVCGIDVAAPSAFPDVDACERARCRAVEAGLRPRLVCVAQLYGSRHCLAAIAAWCRTHDLVLVEDAAQLPLGRGWRAQPRVAASLFSHGPIKSDCAGGGGWLVSRDRALVAAIAAIQDSWPRQTRADYRRRLRRTLALWVLSRPPVFTAAWNLLCAIGRDPDAVLTAATRAFPGSRDPERFARRPHPALVAAMHRARRRGRRREPYRRAVAAAAVAATGRPPLGAGGEHHHLWLHAVTVEDPAAARAPLRAAGYDTGGTGQLAVLDPDACPRAAALHARMVVLPDPETDPRKARVRAARIAGILAGSRTSPSATHPG